MSEWISVKDRLPEKEQEVLIWGVGTPNDKTYGHYDTGVYNPDMWQPWWEFVTHWMPLPMPPDTEALEMKKINRYARRNYQPEEVYTFSVTLCDNEIDRDYERFSVEALETFLKMYLGKRFILSHKFRMESQTARVYDTWLEWEPERKTKAGEEHMRLMAKAYIPREDINQESINLIDRGIWKEASISCAVKRSVCSVCGQEECSHMKGEVYDGQLCHRVLLEPVEAYECAFVREMEERKSE